jgi:SEC-C motif
LPAPGNFHAGASQLLIPMTRPAFTHPVFDQLYERDYFIDDAVLREILALGPDVAGPELLKIIEVTLEPTQHRQVLRGDWYEQFHFLHALYLLHDLQAPAVLDIGRRLLRLGDDTTDYWFGDDLFEEMPGLLARAGRTQLPELLAMLEDPDLSLSHRLLAAGALLRLAQEQPALRPAISAFLRQHLQQFITRKGLPASLKPRKRDKFEYDADTYLGLLLAEIQDADLRELDTEMRQLHRLGLVDESISGGEADIDYENHNPPRPVPDIFARYQELRQRPDNYSPFHPDAAALAQKRAEEQARHAKLREEFMHQQHLTRQPRLADPKIGRNDPCPCGSGKKHKKCCGA